MKLNSKLFILSVGAQSLALLPLAAALHPVMAQQLVVAVESAAFALDTRLSVGNDASVLVVSATSSAFTLNTSLAGPLEALIVQSASLPFDLNTMWIGIRNAARMSGSPLELFWSTNAPGFHPQWALPPLRTTVLWQDMTNSVTESGGFYRILLNPGTTERYFRLKL